jgi:hypothetical protein
MSRCRIHSTPVSPAPLVWDMRDCYTDSFPEFLPFCTKLYYFSSLKAFKTIVPA